MFADLKAVVKYYKENYGPYIEHLPDDQITDFARWNVRLSDSGVWRWKMDPAVRTGIATTQPRLAPWDAVKAIGCPALILRGANSDVLSTDVARATQEAMKDARLVEVPGVGHAPVLTEPVAMAALDEFLAGMRPAERVGSAAGKHRDHGREGVKATPKRNGLTVGILHSRRRCEARATTTTMLSWTMRPEANQE